MKRKDALAELIEKANAGFDPEGRPSAFKALRDPDRAAWALKAHNGSLDAAKALRVSILPGPVPEKIHSDARKELLSILRALHSMEPDA